MLFIVLNPVLEYVHGLFTEIMTYLQVWMMLMRFFLLNIESHWAMKITFFLGGSKQIEPVINDSIQLLYYFITCA